MADATHKAAEILFKLWHEYQEHAESADAEDLKDSWNASERACGVMAGLTRLGYRIKTHYELIKVSE